VFNAVRSGQQGIGNILRIAGMHYDRELLSPGFICCSLQKPDIQPVEEFVRQSGFQNPFDAIDAGSF
jgi:hypothetical protein